MTKLIFIRDQDEYIREASSVTLEVPDDMNIFEFKIMCVRLAASLGYTENSIKRGFGSIEYEDDVDSEFLNLISSIIEQKPKSNI